MSVAQEDLLRRSIDGSSRADVFLCDNAASSKLAFQAAKKLCQRMFPVRIGRVTFHPDGGSVKLLGGALVILAPPPDPPNSFDLERYLSDLDPSSPVTTVEFHDWPA